MLITLVVGFLVISFICGLIVLSACVMAGRAGEQLERPIGTTDRPRSATSIPQRAQVILD